VRLAGACVIRCEGVVRGEAGDVKAVRCSYDATSMGGGGGRRAGGTIHWVHATRSIPATVRLYDRLFNVEQPDALINFLDALNPSSLVEAPRARVEPALREAAPGSRYQFLRQGYFFADPVDSRPGAPVWNRTSTLKDTWATRGAEPEPRRPRERKPSPAAAPGRGRDEVRAEARAADPAAAARFERFQSALGLAENEAHLLSSDAETAAYFEAAVAAGARPSTASRWLLNELAGAAGGVSPGKLPLGGAAFGKFVALVDAGRLVPAAGKTLLADLLEGGGEPEARMQALGLEKVSDRGAVVAAVDRALAASAREVERYRAGKKKLLGVLLGAAMRETQGAADPALVRQVLLERLGTG
jgi:glutaminyl-tRNA synthetase